MFNLRTWCRLKRVIQFLFEGVDELSRVVRIGDEHIVCLHNHDDDFSVLLNLKPSKLVKVDECKLF